MLRFFSAIVKIMLISILTGATLSALNISSHELLSDLGLTPEQIFETLEMGARWAAPHLILGAIVVVPIWIIVHLFRPPRT